MAARKKRLEKEISNLQNDDSLCLASIIDIDEENYSSLVIELNGPKGTKYEEYY